MNSNVDQLYMGWRLEDVRGAMSSVARNTPGCCFLVRMVAEGGTAMAQQVLHKVTGDVVRLMAAMSSGSWSTLMARRSSRHWRST